MRTRYKAFECRIHRELIEEIPKERRMGECQEGGYLQKRRRCWEVQVSEFRHVYPGFWLKFKLRYCGSRLLQTTLEVWWAIQKHLSHFKVTQRAIPRVLIPRAGIPSSAL